MSSSMLTYSSASPAMFARMVSALREDSEAFNLDNSATILRELEGPQEWGGWGRGGFKQLDCMWRMEIEDPMKFFYKKTKENYNGEKE
ncbi:hypothetical protein NL676_014561 [Syzygium grande]|nr:hypothetical protein NL676_014561 [Syzygium grande]